MKTRKPQRPPAQPRPAPFGPPRLVQIEKPIYGGAFLARDEGKAVFVPLALPGEQARVRVVEEKRGYATVEIEELVVSAPERVAPGCRHFGVCGGCQYQHAGYETQLQIKQTVLRETLQRGGVAPPADIEILAGQPWRYRNRIRLAFDAQGNPGYRGRRSHAVVPISECPISAPLLVRAALVAAEEARQFAPALRPTEVALFCDADETAVLMTLFTAGGANVRFDEFALAVRKRITELTGAELVIEGGMNQQPRTVARWGATSLTYRAVGADYRVDHGAFFQVNRGLVDALVEWVTAGHRGKLAWDLFAGVGLFARRLANRFERVIAVESAPAAFDALEANLAGTTGSAVRATTLDFLRPNPERADLHPRDEDLSLHLKKQTPLLGNPGLGTPDLVVVDPPRTGLGADITTRLVEIAPPALVYVSCDPATLARDLRMLLGKGYALESVTLADLFPQTFHLETVVRLRRS